MCAFRDQVALDFGERGEERRHDLDLDVLFTLDADLLLDGAEGVAFPGQRVEHRDGLAERAAESGEFTENEPVVGVRECPLSRQADNGWELLKATISRNLYGYRGCPNSRRMAGQVQQL